MSDDEVNAAVGDRLSDILGAEGEMVTKWCALVEIVDADGARWIRVLTNPEAKAWDNLGMLTFAVQMEQARAIQDE